MKILLIGSGGREHALAEALRRSPRTTQLYCAPGSDAMRELAECVDISATDVEGLGRFALDHAIELTVVGPEAPLVAGISDHFLKLGLKVFGPSRAAAALEGSKVFTKNILKKYRIPTAASRTFDDPRVAAAWIEQQERYPLVLKADGLAAGKGVVIAPDFPTARGALGRMMVQREFGAAGNRVLVEEFLQGEECSVMAITDGETIVTLDAARDYKAAFDGDAGPNTGGMGAYCPSTSLEGDLSSRIDNQVLIPIVHAMNREGKPYQGVIYAGIMLTEDGPKVLEFNVRFGDPEAQVILPRLKSDLVEIALMTCDRSLAELGSLEFDPDPAVVVVLASEGYPEAPKTGRVIRGIEEASAMEQVTVYHSGTRHIDGTWLTQGGRVLGVVGRGERLEDARLRAYQAVAKISFPGMHLRRDIARSKSPER